MKRSIHIVFSISVLSLLTGTRIPPVSMGGNSGLRSQGYSISFHLEDLIMNQNEDPSAHRHHLFGRKFFRHTPAGQDREFLRLLEELRRRNKLYGADVQWLVAGLEEWSDADRRWAFDQLQEILEADRKEDVRTGDEFRPLAPPQLLAAGDLHLLDQVDGAPWKAPWTAMPRGMLVTGPQGAGKTRLLVHLCKQLNAADPPIPWFILDPKNEFKSWSGDLGAVYIDADRSNVGMDISPPPGLTYEAWLPSLMPQLGEIIGLIYGVEILQESAQICIDARERHRSQSNRSTEICLQDICDALPLVKGASSWRRGGYKDAALTGLSRILSGSGNLFRCRNGIDLERLFHRNVVLGTRSITDALAAQFLAVHILYWLHESERSAQPTDQPKSVLIIDDASRYLAARDTAGRGSLSSLGSILTTLRSSGRCFVAVAQVPHLIDPSVCALLHTIINIGGLHHTADTQLLARMMGMTEPQRVALTTLGRREAVGLCGGSAWPKVVHGFVPDVPDPVVTAAAPVTDLPELKTEPYESLFGLANASTPSQDRRPPAHGPSATAATATTAAATPGDSGPAQGLAGLEKTLGIDIVTYLASTVRERQQRLGISARQLETLKGSLRNKDLIREVPLGKNLMLAPTKSLFEQLGLDCPYRRNAWDVHSYLTMLAAKLIESDPLVRQVKTEVSIGDASSTVDLIATLTDLNRVAYEVTHQTVTNVSANAAKLEGKGFSRICFLCLDFNVKQRVSTQLRNAGFAADFLATIECTIFADLIRAHQKRRKHA
jgi:hypothetical protein